MTPAIVEALQQPHTSSNALQTLKTGEAEEPSLLDPVVGNPISHGQIIDISKQTKVSGQPAINLETLLRGSRVYNPPPLPKSEPVCLSLPQLPTSNPFFSC